MKQTLSLIAILAASTSLAEDARQLDAHEHGVGALNIAIDGSTVGMEFNAPGADIVGFEYAAESETDRAAVDAAVAKLATPLDLFVFSAEAACSVTQASAALESEEAEAHHEDHDDEDHHGAHDEHHDDADHGEHAEHDEHSEEAGHTEFHATYTLNCGNPEALTQISFEYFGAFPNARELELQVVTAAGAQAFEVDRDSPVLNLQKLF